jgi:alpha-N-arabinofuranosidase
MRTYLEWDREVLEQCWDTIDCISAHRYSLNTAQNAAEFLAEGVDIERTLADYAGLLAYVRGLKRSSKQVYLSFDEWNIWYRKRGQPVYERGDWKTAPPLLEEIYNLEDALVAAQYLHAFIRRADLLKFACIAQLVNVIAPIMTRRDGLYLQTIFHPFLWLSQHARGQSVHVSGGVPTYHAGKHGQVPLLDTAATFDPATGRYMLSVVNRSLDQSLPLRLRVLDREPSRVAFAQQLGGRDLQLSNTWEQPEALVPQPATARIDAGLLHVTLPPTTHTVVVVETKAR